MGLAGQDETAKKKIIFVVGRKETRTETTTRGWSYTSRLLPQSRTGGEGKRGEMSVLLKHVWGRRRNRKGSRGRVWGRLYKIEGHRKKVGEGGKARCFLS